jgi:hypothetical protein
MVLLFFTVVGRTSKGKRVVVLFNSFTGSTKILLRGKERITQKSRYFCIHRFR